MKMRIRGAKDNVNKIFTGTFSVTENFLKNSGYRSEVERRYRGSDIFNILFDLNI